jgi:PAS domain S-box-containing protein
VGSKKANILLVDDLPANLLALQAVLAAPDYELIEASSGAEAVKLCGEKEFALVILDVSMPGMDGFETALKIKSTGNNRDVPIIFVTATYREDPYMKKGYDVGAVDFFGKPFDPDILRSKVAIYTDLYLKTKRLTETEELLKSHAQIKTLLDAMPVGVVVTDAKGKVYECNEEAKRILGKKSKEKIESPIGHQEWRLEDGNPMPADEWPITKALETGEPTEDQRAEIGGGAWAAAKSVSHSTYPIRGKQGKVLGSVMVLQDLTDRKMLANQIHDKAVDFLMHPRGS